MLCGPPAVVVYLQDVVCCAELVHETKELRLDLLKGRRFHAQLRLHLSDTAQGLHQIAPYRLHLQWRGNDFIPSAIANGKEETDHAVCTTAEVAEGIDEYNACKCSSLVTMVVC